MSTGYSKTLLRKGVVKSHGGHGAQRHAPRHKGGTSGEEEALLLGGLHRQTPRAAAARGENEDGMI